MYCWCTTWRSSPKIFVTYTLVSTFFCFHATNAPPKSCENLNIGNVMFSYCDLYPLDHHLKGNENLNIENVMSSCYYHSIVESSYFFFPLFIDLMISDQKHINYVMIWSWRDRQCVLPYLSKSHLPECEYYACIPLSFLVYIYIFLIRTFLVYSKLAALIWALELLD